MEWCPIFFGCPEIIVYNLLKKNLGPTLPGWWYTYPSEKYESQLGSFFTIYGKILVNVPNHQPVTNVPCLRGVVPSPTGRATE